MVDEIIDVIQLQFFIDTFKLMFFDNIVIDNVEQQNLCIYLEILFDIFFNEKL